MARTPIPWGRLAAEFVVIVVGVLVALGFDSWRSGLQDTDDRQRLLAALSRELQTNIQDLDESVAQQQAYLDGIRRLMRVHRGIDPVPDTAAVIQMVYDALTFATIDPTFSAYDAMIASGQSRLLPNEELAAQLASYRWKLERGHGDEELFTQFFLDLVAAVDAHGGAAAYRSAEDFSMLGLPPMGLTPDIEGLLRDPALFSNLYTRLVTTNNITGWWREMRDELAVAHSMVREHLDDAR